MSIHVCISTQNQTVNLLPALSLNAEKVFIVSSEGAERGNWTELLKLVLTRKKIKSQVIHFNEKETDEFSDRIYNLLKQYDQIYWNISGGKKSQTIALIKLVSLRDEKYDDCTIYLENQPFELCIYKGFSLIKREKISEHLDLEDVLNLYGYTCINEGKFEAEELTHCPDNCLNITKINQYFINNILFTELLYNYMQPMNSQYNEKAKLEEKIKSIIKQNRPLPERVLLQIDSETKTYFQNFERHFNNFKMAATEDERREALNHLHPISNIKIFYNNYWSKIKDGMVSLLKENIENDNPGFFLNFIDEGSKNVVLKLLNECGGSYIVDEKQMINISFNISIGFLFEKMVQELVSQFIEKNKDNIDLSGAFINVKTYRLRFDDCGTVIYPHKDRQHTNDDELDIVLVTNYGTLKIIEVKTYGFEGDVLKGQRDTAFTKSGPFGTVCFVTPLLYKLQNEKGNYPKYVPQKLCQSVDNFTKHGIKSCFFDRLEEDFLRSFLKNT